MKFFTASILCLKTLIAATLITTASAQYSDKNEKIKAWTKIMLSDRLKIERRNNAENNPSKGVWFLTRNSNTGEESWMNACDYIEEGGLLNLGNSNLCGSIPANIVDLKDQITELFLDDNFSLEGDLSVLSEFTNLKILNLSHNSFEGDLSFVKNLKNLEEIHLSDNKFSNDLSPVSDLTKLQVLDVSDNNITGDLSPLSDLKQLRTLLIGPNQTPVRDQIPTQTPAGITGDLSPLSSLIHLEYLDLDNNQLKGDLSPLSSLIHLEHLSLNNNQLTGDLSPLRSLTHLDDLSLTNNYLTGNLSPLAKLKKLESVTLFNNQLTGSLDDLGDELENLTFMDVSYNRLQGPLEIPYWFQIYNAKNPSQFIMEPQQNKRRRLR